MGGVVPAQRDRGDHFVGAAGETGEHRLRGTLVGRLAEQFAVDHDFGVGAQNRARLETPRSHRVPAGVGLGPGDALDVVGRRLAVTRDFEHVGRPPRRLAKAQDLERDADLREQFLPPRAPGCEPDLHGPLFGWCRAHSRW